MSPRLEPKDLAAYVGRDWDRVRESKKTHWAAQARAEGPMAGLRVSEALWAHAKSVDPDWPSAASRKTDLEHHIHLASMMRRLAHVFDRP